MGLDLETLEEFNFSTPSMYKNLQLLTDKTRNRYQAPKTRPSGLKLLTLDNTAPELQLPNLDKSEADYLPEEREEHGENTEYNTSPPLLSTNTTEDMGMGEADEPDQIPSQYTIVKL